MSLLQGWKRWSAALATAAASVSVAVTAAAPAPAGAAPARTATTTSYTTATFLQDDLGFSSSVTSPVIQPVTYDEFQWLLQQSGNYAFLIGDPATDANFPAEAQQVESAAEADHVADVYWFDPNLSGGGYFTTKAGAQAATSPAGTAVGTQVGSTYEPNLDIRQQSTLGEIPSTSSTGAATGTFSLTPASQAIYAYSWDNLVAQYLGDGVSEFLSGVDTESAKVSLAEFGTNTGTYTYTVNGVSTPYTVGNGQSYIANPDANDAIAPVNTAVNDYGTNAGYSTQISNGSADTSGGALYDYSTGSAPATVDNSFFFTYNAANTVTVSATAEPEKVTNWVNLDTESNAANLAADVTTALNNAKNNTAGGASGLASPSQFDWWGSDAGAKANEAVNGTTALASSLPANGQNGDVPLLTSADNKASDGGWRIDQITYPELVDLLKSGATNSNAVILFGGTWCPNTRPVLPAINKYAQENNVAVFNFDTVLDGGTTAGGTTSSVNPLQTRNYAGNGGSADPIDSNASFLYGDLESAYLSNIETQYDPTLGTGFVSYYPGGVTTSALKDARKLQVPFLIGYQKGASAVSTSGGVTRQWIDPKTDVNGLPYYIEYMSAWDYVDPQPYELGIGTSASSGIPKDAPIWSTLNSEQASLTWQTTPASVDPNTGNDSDDASYLDSADYAQLEFYPSSGAATTVLPVAGASSSATAGPVTVGTGANAKTYAATAAISISPASLSAALSALGSSAPANRAAAVSGVLAGYNSSPQPSNLGALETVAAAWSVADNRKSTVITRFGNADSPSSLIGAANAVHALDLFFGGLPGGVVSTQTVSASPVSYGNAPQITVAIANQYGRIPTSNVSLVVQKVGGSTVDTASVAVSQGAASFTLPVLAPGTYTYTVSYPGDSQILPFTNNGSLTVSQSGAQLGVSTNVTKAPSPTADGQYDVTIATPGGLSAATGTATVRFTKGSDTETATGQLSDGRVSVVVPKLAPGTWTVAISWAGDANYPAASWTGASIDVSRIKANKVAGAVAKAPTAAAAGKYKVTIAAPAGVSAATGKVTIKLRKGSVTKTISGKLSHGAVTLATPKLARGTWKVAISWAGDSIYVAESATGSAIKVTR